MTSLVSLIFGWGGSSWGLGSGVLLLGSSLLFLEELGEDLLVSLMSFFACLPSLLLASLGEHLSSQSDFGNESLDLWWLISGFAVRFNSSSDNILGWIILLSESESLSKAADSLWSKSSWSGGISQPWDISVSLDENLKCNDWEIWSTDASSGGLSLSLSLSSGSVEWCSVPHEDLDSTVNQNTLFHGESLLIISSGDS